MSTTDKYRFEEPRYLWYCGTKKYREGDDTGTVEKLYRGAAVVPWYRPTLRDIMEYTEQLNNQCAINNLVWCWKECKCVPSTICRKASRTCFPQQVLQQGSRITTGATLNYNSEIHNTMTTEPVHVKNAFSQPAFRVSDSDRHKYKSESPCTLYRL